MAPTGNADGRQTRPWISSALAHSFNYAARLQEVQSCANPVLVRIETETKAGHGAGKPTSKQNE